MNRGNPHPLSQAICLALACSLFTLAEPTWAQTKPDNPKDGTPSSRTQDSQPTTLNTIVVTADKRPETLQDVASSVSAMSGTELADIGAQSLADYISLTPGVTFNKYQPGVSHVVIRGIATSSGNVQG